MTVLAVVVAASVAFISGAAAQGTGDASAIGASAIGASATDDAAYGDNEHAGHDHGDVADDVPFGHGHTNISEPIAGDGPSLDTVLEWADEHAPLVRIANGEISAAQAQREGAVIRVPQNPTFGFGVGGRTSSGTTRPEVVASIQQPFWINGSRGARLSLADAVEAVASAEREVVLWQVHVEAHRLYVQAQVARQRIIRAQAMVEHAAAHQQISARKVELGEAAPPTLLITESNYARAQALLIEAQRMEESVRIELAGWIGWRENSIASVPVDHLPLLDLPDADALLELMASSHPSISARRAAIAAAESQVELSHAERTTTPTIGAQYSFENEADAASHVWRFTAEVPIPIARRNQEDRARAAAQAEIEAAQLEVTSRRLRTELLSTLASLERYQAEVALYEASVMPRLNENLSLLLRAFQLGEIDIHEVAAVHEQALDSISEYLTALERYYDAAAMLEGLVGAEIWEHTGESHE